MPDSSGRTEPENDRRRRSVLRLGPVLFGGLLAGCFSTRTGRTPSDTATSTPSTSPSETVAGSPAKSPSDTPATATSDALSRPPSVEWVRWYEPAATAQEVGTPVPGADVEVVAAVTTADGGYALAGHVDLPDEARHSLLLKTDAEGREQWRRRFGNGAEPIRARGLLRTADGGFLVVGQLPFPPRDERETPVETDPGRDGRRGAAVRTDSRGRVRWRAFPAPDTPGVLWDAASTPEGGFALAGWVERDDEYAGWFATLDTSGRIVANETFDSPNDEADRVHDYTVADLFTTVTVTGDGGIVLAGKNATGGQVRKLDAERTPVWTRQFDFPRDVAYDAVPTADGGVVLTGRLFDDESRAGPTALYLTRLDASGEERWTRAYEAGHNEYGHTVEPTADGGYLVAGGSVRGPNGRDEDVFAVKTGPDGRATWQATYLESTRGTVGYDLVRAPDGGYALAAGDVFLKFEGATTPPDREETPAPAPTTSSEPSGSP